MQVFMTDSMMRSQKPCIQIPEDYVYHWEMLVHLSMITLDGYWFVFVA
ncbi:hypothetical protein JCM12296A_47340 [Desulfosarcina cetonica]